MINHKWIEIEKEEYFCEKIDYNCRYKILINVADDEYYYFNCYFTHLGHGYDNVLEYYYWKDKKLL